MREKLGSLKSERAVSLIAIHAHGISNQFSRETLAEAERAGPATMKGREDWRNVPLVTITMPLRKNISKSPFSSPVTFSNHFEGAYQMTPIPALHDDII